MLVLAFLIPLAVYIYTLCPTISVYADAGEFPMAAYVSGFGHPPGYPLFILIIKLFQLLPFGNPALRANLASAFIAAATIALFYLLVREIAKNSYLALISAWILAFSRIFWREAIVSEVFSLLAFFTVLCLLMFFLWDKTEKKKYFWGFAAAAGFGLAHHQLLLIPLAPLGLYFLVKGKWRTLSPRDYGLGILAFASGFLPYFYILWSARHFPIINWENPVNLTNLWRVVRRASYGTFTLTNESGNSVLLDQISGLSKLLFRNFTVLGSGLFVLGGVLTAQKNRKLAIYALLVVASVSVFSIFSGMPLANLSQIQYLERFQIISIIIMALLIGYGLGFLQKLTPAWFLLLIPLTVLVLNYKQVSQRGNYFADDFAQDLVGTLPPKSIFLMGSDAQINILLYYRWVLGKRADVAFIVAPLLPARPDWYLEEIKLRYPDIVIPNPDLPPRDFLIDFISLNASRRPLFFSVPGLETTFNIDLPKVRRGLIWQYPTQGMVIEDISQETLNWLKSARVLQKPRPTDPESAEYALLNLYSESYIALAEMNDNEPQLSEKYYNSALELTPDNVIALIEMGDDYLMYGESQKALASWRKALQYAWDPEVKAMLNEKIDQYKGGELND